MVKLHLGCGERYLQDYINIDYPSASHSVQKKDVADVHVDILELRYPAESVEEVRLHHVFEHITRPVSCALLASWHSWLEPYGTIRLEVPDFQKMAIELLNPLAPFKRRAVAERHIFGSHEAFWAVHCEEYTPSMLKRLIETYGFKISKLNKNSWRGTSNIEVIAEKLSGHYTRQYFAEITNDYLSSFLLDKSESETRLLSVWMDIFNVQMNKSWEN